MKLIDEKGKLFGKFNAIDICVIIIVIVLAFGAFYKFRVNDKTKISGAMLPITYTVEVKRIRDYVYNNVKEGDLLYDKTSGNCIGKIVKINGTPAMESLSTIDGSYKNVEVQNRIDVVFTIEGEGVKSDKEYLINKTYELVRGSSKKFMTKYFECDGKVGDIL